MMRNLGAIAGLAIFTVVWWGIVYFLRYAGAPLLFPIVFGLAGLLMLYGLLEMILYRSTVDVDEGGLSVRGGWLGIGRTRRIAREGIERLSAKRGMQSGRRVYYSIIAACRGGKSVTLGKRLPSQRQAELVIDEIERTMESAAR
jgi:hypothetical protein